MDKNSILTYYNEKKKVLTATKYKMVKRSKEELDLIEKYLKQTEDCIELLNGGAQNGQMIKETANWYDYIKKVRQDPKLKFNWFRGESYAKRPSQS